MKFVRFCVKKVYSLSKVYPTDVEAVDNESMSVDLDQADLVAASANVAAVLTQPAYFRVVDNGAQMSHVIFNSNDGEMEDPCSILLGYE